jgi:hypothetical protein
LGRPNYRSENQKSFLTTPRIKNPPNLVLVMLMNWKIKESTSNKSVDLIKFIPEKIFQIKYKFQRIKQQQ